MRFVLAAALAITVTVPVPAAADPAQDKAREAAVASWLEDDEASALAAFSDLARAGDVASALLLAVLETRGPETPYRASLTAAARRDLFHAPGSAFGKPWADAVPAEAAPQIVAALKALRSRDWPAALAAALAAGELPLARQAALGLANDSPKRLLELDSETPLPRDLRPIVWLAAAYWAGQTADDGDVARVLAELAAAPDGLGARVAASALPDAAGGEPQAAALGDLLRTGRPSPPPDFATLTEGAALIAAAPEGRTLAKLCAESCPQDRDGCIVAGNTAARGYLALTFLDTPLVTVIPSDRYRDSPRARTEFLRVTMGSSALLSMLPDTPGGACLSALIPKS